MKKAIFGATAMLLTTIVNAQNTPAKDQPAYTFYGVADLGVEMTSGAGNVSRMGFGTESSKVGVRGSRSLGDGLNATFQLEGGFSSDDGTLANGGRLWGRFATVGLAGEWGEVKFGRQLTMLIPAMMDSDNFGPSWYGNGTLDSYLPNARADNAIGYMGKFGGVDVGATYSFGRDVANNSRPSGTNCAGENSNNDACKETSLMVRYRGAAWGVSAGYDEITGNTGAFGGLTTSDTKDKRSVLGGYAMLGEKFKLGLGALNRDNGGNKADPTSNLYYISATYKMTDAVTLEAQAANLKFEKSSNSADYYIARIKRRIANGATIYGMASQINNSAKSSIAVSPGLPTAPGLQQTGVILGITLAF